MSDQPIKKIKAGGKDLIVKAAPPLTLPPKTTEQEDLVTAGQRKINVLWESTQSIIAIAITGATIYCAINDIDARVIFNAFFLVVSMYLVRTNHKLTGGVPPNYKGR